MSVLHRARRGAQSAILALFVGMTAGGCVAAAPLVSAAIAAAPLLGRSVDRTLSADVQTTWRAVETTLTDMAFRVESRDRPDAEWRLRGVAEDMTVDVTLERVTSRLTRVTLRVETGGLLSDRKTADVIHDHIAKVVDAANRAPARELAGEASREALRSLEAEVRRLRTQIEDQGSVGRSPAEQPAPNQAPLVRVEPSAIVTVPVSAALPTTPGLVPPTSVIQPAGALIPTTPDVPVVSTSTSRDETPASGSERIVPAPPGDTLVPVRPVSAPGSRT